MKLKVPPGGPPRTRVVAFASAKGSPGCTFLAVGLARCLADHGLETLLIDADAESPAVAAALALEGEPGGADLIGSAALGVDTELLQQAAVSARPRLRALELQPGGVEVGRDVLDGREVVEAARGLPATVIDLGHRWGRLQRQLAAGADWLLWVVGTDRVGLERADRVLGQMLPGAGRGIVVNRASRWSIGGAERVLAERHRLPLVARLPEHRRSARRVSERGAAAHRERAFRPGLQMIARAVHPDLEGTGTWP